MPDNTLGIQDQHRRCAHHSKLASQVEALFGINLDERDAMNVVDYSNTLRVARHGAQNALENSTSVARSPSG